jgi:hypothetical protein
MIAFLLHDADEQNDPDEGVYAQLDMENEQREQRAECSEW